MAKPDMKQLMELAQKMQKNMQDMQKTIANKKITATAGSGEIIVRVVMNGEGLVESVEISPEAFKQSIEVLSDLIAAAVNKATTEVKSLTKGALMDIYQKAGIPPAESE